MVAVFLVIDRLQVFPCCQDKRITCLSFLMFPAFDTPFFCISDRLLRYQLQLIKMFSCLKRWRFNQFKQHKYFMQ